VVSKPSSGPSTAAILDIDGTLVDTNYHHAVAWFRAFRLHGHVVPLWRIHRHIGMGGDKLVASLLSEEVDEREGEDIRAAEKAMYFTFIAEVEPLRGARELIQDLHDRGRKVVLASSAKADEVDHYLELLDARSLADGWTTSADVEATKPDPDLVLAAMDQLGDDAKGAIMIGDSTWDCRAAEAAGIRSIAVLTGGFSEEELRAAGAAEVYRSIEELRQGLDDTPLG
jgi:HAD superfamily hydrolase (TIGR01509 family)